MTKADEIREFVIRKATVHQVAEHYRLLELYDIVEWRKTRVGR